MMAIPAGGGPEARAQIVGAIVDEFIWPQVEEGRTHVNNKIDRCPSDQLSLAGCLKVGKSPQNGLQRLSCE